MTYSDFSPIIELHQIRNWSRIILSKHSDGLGTGLGLSRFCNTGCGFEVLYLARDYETAFAEAVLRDKLNRRAKRFLTDADLANKSSVTISSVRQLKLLNLRGNGALKTGIPSAAIKHTNHKSGRSLSRYLHKHYDVDGILFDSRLTGAPCIAIYSDSKSAMVEINRDDNLLKLTGTSEFLREYNIKLLKTLKP
ncbi:MAG: hypothetical protein COA43_00760 [Robiginitomaculum sp.]|nr:MAG: hypothetical protein COA43_00760 [Robiginitomaculum sp.]